VKHIVLDGDIGDTAADFGADRNAPPRPHRRVLNGDVSRWPPKRPASLVVPRLDGDMVVSTRNVAVLDQNVFGRIWVDPVSIGAGWRSIDGDVMNMHP